MFCTQDAAILVAAGRFFRLRATISSWHRQTIETLQVTIGDWSVRPRSDRVGPPREAASSEDFAFFVPHRDASWGPVGPAAPTFRHSKVPPLAPRPISRFCDRRYNYLMLRFPRRDNEDASSIVLFLPSFYSAKLTFILVMIEIIRDKKFFLPWFSRSVNNLTMAFSYRQKFFFSTVPIYKFVNLSFISG